MPMMLMLKMHILNRHRYAAAYTLVVAPNIISTFPQPPSDERAFARLIKWLRYTPSNSQMLL
jgi:hypothetical protein